MVACLDDARVEVNVFNILIGRRVSKKYPGEIVVVKFGMSFACFLGAQARSKNPEA